LGYPNVVSDYQELQKRLAANEEAMQSLALVGATVAAPAAASYNGSSSSGAAAPPLEWYGGGGDGRLERRAVEECVRGALAENRKELRRDVQNLHLDMLRQFEEQQQVRAEAAPARAWRNAPNSLVSLFLKPPIYGGMQAIGSLLDAHAHKMASLVAENQQLRRENAELRRMY
jgi:hypothetical protein